MKKKMMLLFVVLALLCTVSCGKEDEDSTHSVTGVKIEEVESGGERPSLEEPEHSENAAEKEDAQGEFQFSDLSDRVFYFSSGAGAWFTELRIRGDGSFEGHYQDADMGDAGDDYPNGTLYYCDFYGTFDQLEKLDDFTYKMRLSYISFKEEPEKDLSFLLLLELLHHLII